MEQKQVIGLLDEYQEQLIPLKTITGKQWKVDLLDHLDLYPTTYSNQLFSSNTSTSSINYFLSLIYNSRVIVKEKPIPTIVSEDIDQPVYPHLPLFFQTNNYIKIPTKVKTILEDYVPNRLLRKIHPDLDVAIELCLMFLSNLSSMYFIARDNPDDPVLSEGWKALHSDILIQQFSLEINTYCKIVKALTYPLRKGPILECDRVRKIGSKSYYYRFGDKYRNKGIISYHLQTEVARRLLLKNCNRLLGQLTDNPIAQNLFTFYSQVQLPTLDEIMVEARRLTADGFKTKKGKKLTFLNKHGRSYYKDASTRSFVEDAIEIYKYLTEHGLMIPIVGDERSGGRVVDSFTLMPGWIRSMIKINGKPLVEVDYSALHPNIACAIYGGKMKYITHGQVAEESGIDKDLVKLEHLSFFNKEWADMMHSPLYGYYVEKEPMMMTNIYFDKAESEYGHKITSRRLFKVEVEIMTQVVNRLNEMGIYPGYVYDALLCKEEDKEVVMAVMDEVAMLNGVYTKAK